MRTLLVLLLMAPAFAQTAPAPDAAAQQPAAAPAPAKTDAAAPSPAPSPAPAAEPNFTGSIDLGYRWLTDVSGNFQQFRSVVNLRQGPEVLGLDFSIQDPKKRLFDRMNVRAYGWGGEPYNTANVDARKLGIYDFSVDYRNIAYFNAVPSFANPLAPAGFDEQLFDLRRRTMNINLGLLPGKHISPYLAFERNSGHGSGIDTWVQDSNNEYAVATLLRDRTSNFRGGVRFEYSRFHVTLEQGGTTYRNDDQASGTGTNLGDNRAPLLGQTLALTGLVQAYGIRGDSIYSKALVTGSPAPWLNVYGQFLYSQPKTTVSYSDIATGNFAMLSSLLFYSGEQTIGTGAANQPHTTANLGFEVRPTRRLRIVESWSTDRYHDAASPVVAQQILLSAATRGPNLVTSLNYNQYVNYNQQSVDAFVDVSRRITLHGGYRYIWGDAQVLAGQLSQTGTLVPGQLQRNVGVAGLSYRTTQKLWINLDYEGASSDHIYFRTSLNNYNKARARVRYQANAALSVQANFQVLNNQNPDPSIRYDFQSRDNSLSVYWTPKGGKRISVMAEYDRSTLRSNISYLNLPFLSAATSAYRDNAHTATSAVDLALPGLNGAKLSFGGSMFISAGSRPSTYYQPLARLSLPLVKHLYWNTEWQWYGFGEAFYLYEGFRTHTFVTGLRLAR